MFAEGADEGCLDFFWSRLQFLFFLPRFLGDDPIYTEINVQSQRTVKQQNN